MEHAKRPMWPLISEKLLRKGGILTIYDPAFEVSNSGMQNTIELFEQKGFFTEV
jgi:hypothetical protein